MVSMTDTAVYKLNRERFAAALPDRTAALLFSGEEKHMSADSDYRFFVDRNFFYLTGLERAGFVLVIEKDDGKVTESIFAPAHDSMKERWHGKRMDYADIAAISGIAADDIHDLEKYEEKEFELIKDSSINIFLDGSSVMNKPFDLKKQIERMAARHLTFQRSRPGSASLSSPMRSNPSGRLLGSLKKQSMR